MTNPKYRDAAIVAMVGEAHAARRAHYPLQMPLWQEPKRAIPTDFVKSALFTARHDRDVVKVERQIIASVEGIVLDYSGRLLTQVHARVWEGLMDGCRRAKANQFQFRGRSFARRLSPRGVAGKSQRVQLRRVLKDLAKTNISVLHMATRLTVDGSMIQLAEPAPDHYVVSVAPGIVTLFHESRVLIDQQLDLQIRGRLAQWMHRYFAATAKPISIAEIRRLSDSQTKSLRKFRQSVIEALIELSVRREITPGGPKVCVLERWQINEHDEVEATPTVPPQAYTTGLGNRPLLLPDWT